MARKKFTAGQVVHGQGHGVVGFTNMAERRTKFASWPDAWFTLYSAGLVVRVPNDVPLTLTGRHMQAEDGTYGTRLRGKVWFFTVDDTGVEYCAHEDELV